MAVFLGPEFCSALWGAYHLVGNSCLVDAQQQDRFRGGTEAKQLLDVWTFVGIPVEVTCAGALAANVEPTVKPVLSTSHGYGVKTVEHRVLDGNRAASGSSCCRRH